MFGLKGSPFRLNGLTGLALGKNSSCLWEKTALARKMPTKTALARKMPTKGRLDYSAARDETNQLV
jgi:hypothetical protein